MFILDWYGIDYTYGPKLSKKQEQEIRKMDNFVNTMIETENKKKELEKKLEIAKQRKKEAEERAKKLEELTKKSNEIRERLNKINIEHKKIKINEIVEPLSPSSVESKQNSNSADTISEGLKIANEILNEDNKFSLEELKKRDEVKTMKYNVKEILNKNTMGDGRHQKGSNMKNYELKLQLQKQMEELNVKEQQDRKTVEQLCTEWNWTLSDKEATIVNNQIVINKGKVVEITKEDNSTIEMLRETIRQMNQNMNDMQKQHEEEITKLKEQYEQQMLGMTSEFEYEYECAINKREEQIKELEEKLDFKELLLSEFRDNMDEKIKTIHELENKVEANKPQEKPVVKETKEENKPAPKQTMRHKNVDMVLYDVHKTHDGAVRGYTKTYEFAWNGKSNVPAYKTKAMKKWHPMIGDMYAEALYIKEQVKDMFKETKEVTVNQAKDITIPTQKPKTTTHVSNGATIVLPAVEAPEDDDLLGNTDDIEF